MARQPARGKVSKKAVPKSYKALNIDGWRQLKRLSADLDKPVGQLQCDAINLLFAKHGLPQIADLQRPRLTLQSTAIPPSAWKSKVPAY